MNVCRNDATIQVGSACRDLDFTIQFEQAILSLLPNAVFILLASLRIRFLLGKPNRLKRSFDVLGGLKLTLGFLLIGATAATTATFHRFDGRLPATTVADNIIQLVASIFLVATALLEHRCSIAPSTLTALYALVAGLFSATQVRTYAAIGLQSAHSSAFTSKALVTAALFAEIFLEICPKRHILQERYVRMPQEMSTSFMLKPFFFHLIPLLYIGSKRRLTLDDLGDVPVHLLAIPTRKRLEDALAKGDPTSPGYLFRATLRGFGGSFGGPIIPRLILLLATYGQVFLVQDMIVFVSDPSIPKERGWALVGGFACIYVSIAMSTYIYWEKTFSIMVAYRSALVGAIYMKTLRLTSPAAREVGQGAATTYMSVDVERITDALEYIHEIWAGVLAIGLACALLYFKASWAFVSPLVMICIILGICGYMSKFVGVAQGEWMSKVDARIKLLSSVVGQLLPIKLGSYEVALSEKINVLRSIEIKALRRVYWLLCTTSSLANMGSTFSGLACIGTYAILLSRGQGIGPLDVSRIFTILTIIQLLNTPINIIGQGLPDLLAAYASMKRIQKFLALPEKTHALPPITGELETLELETKKENQVELRTTNPSELEVTLCGGSFGWDETEKTPVLKNMNLSLVPGALHMVVGAVASGKSTFIMTLLGETIQLAGSVNIQVNKIALATQTAFIYPGDIRTNIVMNGSYEKAWFDRVVHACGLVQDLDRLPNGEFTMLGTRGLSGGQRQRIALARAVYADADLILLDDPLSALDGETEAHVFTSLFGSEGLLRGKTTVLVTHAIQHLPSADRVLVFEAGTISHQGTFEEIRAAGAEHAASSQASANAAGPIIQVTMAAEKEAEVEEDDEELTRDANTSRWAGYIFFLRGMGPTASMLTLFVISLCSACKAAFQGYLKEFAEARGKLGIWVGGYGAFCFALFVSQYLVLLYFSVNVTGLSSRRCHTAELEGVMRSPPSFFQKTAAGKILNRFSQDIQQLDFGFPLALLNVIFSLFAIATSIALVVIATPWLALAIPILGPAYYFIIRFYLATSKQLQRLEAGSKSPLYTLFGTTVSGLVSIRAFGAQGFFESQNNGFLDRSQGPFFFRNSGTAFLRVVLNWMVAFLAVGMAVISVALRHSTSAAMLGVALSQITVIASQLLNFLLSYAHLENSLVSIERIREFAILPPEDSEDSQFDYHSKEGQLWPSTGHVRFKNYSMRFREDLPLALNGLTFDLAGGMKVGICGRTGSGKSSTLLALFRAIDQHLVSGSIEIDGVDVKAVPLTQLRDSMSIVSQDPMLWHGTVRDNLDITQDCTDDEIWAALKSVEMIETVSKLPDKLESLVIDEESFSKGQRQLLCFARALLRKRKLVILDESTSSMDHLTDQAIGRVVDTQMQGFTVIAVAHRISSIIKYDRILLLDDGVIQEYDSPANLLARPESRFARLAATQGIYSVDGAAAPDASSEIALASDEKAVGP